MHSVWETGEEGVEYPGPGTMGLFERKFMTKKISQKEARLRGVRIRHLENLLKGEYAGDRIDAYILSDIQFARVKTATRLGHPVRIVPTGNGNEVKVLGLTL